LLAARLSAACAALLVVAAVGGGAGWFLGRPPGPVPAPAAPPAAQPDGRTDRAGDPLPAGAVARLGTLRFRSGEHGLNALAFLPDGKTLVSAGAYGNSIRVWEAATGRLVREIRTEPLSVRSFAASPDGRLAAVSGFFTDADNRPAAGAVRVLDLASGAEVRTWSHAASDADLGAMAFTRDGKLLLSLVGDGTLRVREVSSGAELLTHRFPRDISGNLALAPDGKTLAVSSGPNSRRLFLWRWQDGEEPREVKQSGRPAALAFSPDSKTLAVLGDYPPTVNLCDVSTGRLMRTLNYPAYAGSLARVAFSPDGKVIAVSELGNSRERNFSGRVTLWDPAGGMVVRELPTPGESAIPVTFSPDSRWLAAGAGLGFHVWDLRTGADATSDDGSHRGSLNGVAVAANGLVATASDDHTARLWDLATGRHLRKVDAGHWIRGVALSPDGTRLVTSSLDDTVGLWDAADGRLIYRLIGHGRSGGNRPAAFAPDGKRFVTFGDDYYLRVWDAATGKALREHAVRPTGVKVSGEDADPRDRERFLVLGAGAFSPDGGTLALGVSNDIHVFDVGTGKEGRIIRGEGGRVQSIAVSAGGKYLVAAAWGKPLVSKLSDGRTWYGTEPGSPLCLWELASGKLVHKIMLPEAMPGPVAFSAAGRHFAAGGEKPQRSVIIYEVASGKPVLRFTDLSAPAAALAFAPDGRHLVATLRDTSALVLDLTRDPGKGP
jgi:WD40 repeat protein